MLYIPEKIKIGFQNRSDTYTGKLGYIIYFDERGKLRKEQSWNNWRNKDIEPQEFDNVPVNGFVLNKKAGDYSGYYGNHRKAYSRVYDPRGFEIEITIENLLFILENCTSTKGKGLEGEFVYSWKGKDLILLPVESPDYKNVKLHSRLINKDEKIKAKDLIVGATYIDKNKEEYINIGRFDKFSLDYRSQKSENKGKHYYFARAYTSRDGTNTYQIHYFKSISNKFISCINEECTPEYPIIFEQIESSLDYCPIDENLSKYTKYSFDEFRLLLLERSWYDRRFFDKDHNIIQVEAKYGYGGNNHGKYEISWINDKRIRTWETYTAQELFVKYAPMYKESYLANGKFYKSTKYTEKD
jgi:hypothetical protein